MRLLQDDFDRVFVGRHLGNVRRCHGLEGPASPEGPVVSFIYLFSFIAFLTF